jgi:quercetin dioxygenase-like cupin family protein
MTQQVEQHTFDAPDEIREFPHGRVELVHTATGAVGRLTAEPGWRWSEHVKPIAGTDWCEAPHFQYQISGTLRVHMADGREFDSGPGDVLSLPEGHDAWVVGDEPVVTIDWFGLTDYAKSPGA